MKPFKVGDIVKTNNFGKCVVTSCDKHDKIGLRFLDTGYETITNAGSLRRKMVQDPYVRTIYGIGYLGTGKYTPKEHFTVYGRFCNLFQRCYGIAYQRMEPTYIGCKVHSSFHSFQDFCDWFYNQYGSELKDIQVDKDLYSKGNRIYSSKRCILLPRVLNLAIRDWDGIGISIRDKGQKKWCGAFRGQAKVFMFESEAIKWRAERQREYVGLMVEKYKIHLDPWAIKKLECRFKL